MTGADRSGSGGEGAEPARHSWGPAKTAGRAGPMKWYADAPAMRARQVVTDVAVALWCLGSIRVAVATSSGLRQLQEPTERLQSAGDLLADGPGPLGVAGEKLAAAGTRAHDGIGRVAFVLGLVVAVALMGWVAARWVPRRLHHAREAGAVLALYRDVDALALRAATTLPLHHLARLGPDPVGRWRRAEPGAAVQLAALQCQEFGVHPPRGPWQPPGAPVAGRPGAPDGYEAVDARDPASALSPRAADR